MIKFEVEYFEKQGGAIPVEEFILSQDNKDEDENIPNIVTIRRIREWTKGAILKANRRREFWIKDKRRNAYIKNYVFLCERAENNFNKWVCEKNPEDAKKRNSTRKKA